MKEKWSRLILVALLSVALVAPALSMSTGPPWETDGELTVEVGCSCHGGGTPSAAVIVSISGVPQSYNLSETYNFSISLTTADESVEGGFMLWSYGVGAFNLDADGVAANANETTAISHSEVGNDWSVEWTAPSEDSGDISFQLVGNAVDNSGLPDEGDAWNILSFFISSPGWAK